MSSLSFLIKPVSGACNMRCKYCFYEDVMDNRETRIYPKMTDETLEKLVRRAFVFADQQISFAFQGGEPTLAGLAFYEKLIRLEKKYNTHHIQVHNAIQTNGYNLSDEMIDFFAREHFLVGVSLDGDRAAHDFMRLDAQGLPTFDRILSNMRRMQEKHVEFNVLCVVTEQCAKRAKQVFEALQEFSYIQFIPCLNPLDGMWLPFSLTPETYGEFLKTTFDLYDRHFWQNKPVSVRNFDNYIGMLLGMPPESCSMAGQCGRYLLVEADGSVYPCDFYVLDEWKMGNVNKDSLFKLDKSSVGEAFRAVSHPVPDVCRSCQWYPLCRNGCRREREQPSNVNKWCESYKTFFEYSYDRMEAIARELKRRER